MIHTLSLLVHAVPLLKAELHLDWSVHLKVAPDEIHISTRPGRYSIHFQSPWRQLLRKSIRDLSRELHVLVLSGQSGLRSAVHVAPPFTSPKSTKLVKPSEGTLENNLCALSFSEHGKWSMCCMWTKTSWFQSCQSTGRAQTGIAVHIYVKK